MKTNPHNVRDVWRLQYGNDRSYALSRLHKERPDLFERVKAKELSPHAAAVEAGFRKRPTPLGELKRWWGKASESDRNDFEQWRGQQPRT